MSFLKLGFLVLFGVVITIQAYPDRQQRQAGFFWRPRPSQRPPINPSPKPTETGGAVGCGVQAPSFQPNLAKTSNKVINGQDAKAHSWPWVIAFLSHGGTVSCGGSLLRAKEGVEETDIVMTAAHCVTRPETIDSSPQAVSAGSLTVAAGRHKFNVPTKYNQISRGQLINFHPKYGAKDDAVINDIALVKLAKPIKFTDGVRPVCLPQQGAAIPTDLTCVAAGWGRNNSHNMFISAQILQQLVLPVHPASICAKGWPKEYKQDSMICAGDLEGKSGVCNGDSGSTLMCKQGDRWVQHGVVSYGVQGECLEANKPDVYARVSSYVNWIKESIEQMTSL